MKGISKQVKKVLSKLEGISQLEKSLPLFKGRLLPGDIYSIKFSLKGIKGKEDKLLVDIHISLLERSEMYNYYISHPGARELLKKSIYLLRNSAL